jgi:hypothetical protein
MALATMSLVVVFVDRPICISQGFHKPLLASLCCNNVTCQVLTNFDMSLEYTKIIKVFEIIAFDIT